MSPSPETAVPLELDVSTLTSRNLIEQHLAELTRHESSLDDQLLQLISAKQPLQAQLDRLGSLKEVVHGIQGEASHLCRQVAQVATTAERVGGKVRVLDQEQVRSSNPPVPDTPDLTPTCDRSFQSRVKEAIEYVQAVQDLKTSIAALDTAIEKNDWEAATRFMQRASAIDPKIVASGFAEAVVPTSDLPQTPPATLSTLRASLLKTFLESFQTAAVAGDTNNINRFFKLFPMIGEEDKGLIAYAEWVAGIVRDKAGQATGKSQHTATSSTGSSPTHFSTVLTNLFESIALIISQHQPVVEKYYGPGKMVHVASNLLTQADQLGLKTLMAWEEERRVRKKLVQVRESRFYGLSTNPTLSGSAGGPLNLRRSAMTPSLTRPGSPTMGGSSTPQPQLQMEDGGVDPREIDALLTETSLMSGRWQLLRRFLYGRLTDDDDETQPEPPSATQPKITATSTNPCATTDDDSASPDTPPTLAMIEESELGQMLSEKLRAVYQPLSIWYLRSSIEKAQQMDELDLNSSPYLSSSLDDTFYILKKTLYRLLSTNHIETVVGMAKEIRTIVDRDVGEVWKYKMDGAFKEVNSSSSAMAVGNVIVGGVHVNVPGGRAREEEKERKEAAARSMFITYLNNLDTASEYTLRMIDEMLAGEALQSSFFVEAELERAKVAFLGVRSLEERFKSILRSGLDTLFNQLSRLRLRPLLADVYKDISYVLNEDTFAEAEYRDDVRKRFVKGWEALLAGYRVSPEQSMTPANYNLFFAHSISVLVRPWESLMRSLNFTELGALKFDKDLRSIQSYLSNQAPFSSAMMRESFSRLNQIAMVLTMESEEEADEVLSAIGNRLTKGEVRSVWGLKIQ
ncbi:BZ3500_MvSof-1268-A1-R1_Chr3-1g05834 [Microbotryum saponariae]|uniref:Conserved oligomeric Golgi complex subunit 4 n=1 Tax=Microbotryum saponariae TaxID=289078 RepID=A0A2X0LDI3_9BASI|nr:BZ3500_MvSof-1268-A1-R1_Chr3-1g05834 [Microbotryum saponariae]SDA05024.1 BZ3501_MvSof-1269-A2-R1_Chr3-1g05504 [Microbotryum saponariae]